MLVKKSLFFASVAFSIILLFNNYDKGSVMNNTKNLILKGHFVDIFVDKVIYHSKITNNFLLKIIIKNTSEKTIGIDLSDYWKVLYPNQWGIYNKSYRDEINEIRITPDDNIDKKEVLFKYINGKGLRFIKQGESIEYYREWNGSGEKINLIDANKYLIISIDGQLLTTDGKDVENVVCKDIIEVVFSYPIKEKIIDNRSLIIQRQ